MAVQKTDWGEILWMEEENTRDTSHEMQVGMVSLNAGAHQARHVHYDEQVIYVLQGEAISLIDGEEKKLYVGEFCHWKAGVVHEVYNTGSSTFHHLLISNSAVREEENEESRTKSEDERYSTPCTVSHELIYSAVEAIRTQFLETIQHCGSFENVPLYTSYTKLDCFT